MSAVVSADSLSTAELKEAFWRSGDLSWKLHEHQATAYTHLRGWEKKPIAQDPTDPYIGAARWYVNDWGRRVGKSFEIGTVLVENGLSFPNARMVYGTRTEIQMKEIMIPTLRAVCADAPDDIRPQFFSSRWGMRAGFHFPSSDSVLKLVGLDKDPDGMRGPHLDWCAISEAAFIKNLRELVVSIIGPQFLRRPHARGYLESSAPEDTEHDFDAFFVPDAKRRNAYWFYTFRDISDPQLREEAELEYKQAVAIDKVAADREYLGIRSRDFSSTVFPEFSRDVHVREVPVPEYAVGIAADDPGYRHLWGKVWAVYDFTNARLIVQDSWAMSNASTTKSACVSAAREYMLWGTWPSKRMASLPLDGTDEMLGWRHYLEGEKGYELCQDLFDMAQMPVMARPHTEKRPGHWVMEKPPDALVYYQREHRFNPHLRVADVDLRLIRDLDDLYGLTYNPTTKEDLRVMVGLVRAWLSDGRIVVQPDAGPIIDHLLGAKWHKDRRHFDEHRVWRHYDVAAALIYLVRAAQTIEHINPFPPGAMHVAREYGDAANTWMPGQDRPEWQQEQRDRIERAEQELTAALADRSRGLTREPPRLKPWK